MINVPHKETFVYFLRIVLFHSKNISLKYGMTYRTRTCITSFGDRGPSFERKSYIEWIWWGIPESNRHPLFGRQICCHCTNTSCGSACRIRTHINQIRSPEPFPLDEGTVWRSMWDSNPHFRITNPASYLWTNEPYGGTCEIRTHISRIKSPGSWPLDEGTIW